jgi:hypothetical protein
LGAIQLLVMAAMESHLCSVKTDEDAKLQITRATGKDTELVQQLAEATNEDTEAADEDGDDYDISAILGLDEIAHAFANLVVDSETEQHAPSTSNSDPVDFLRYNVIRARRGQSSLPVR